MEKLKFLKNSSSDIPQMRLIGEFDRYDASEICNAFKHAKDNGYKRVRMIFNCYGGYINAAYTILTEMNLFMAEGGIIETLNAGRADSAAGWLFSAGTRGERKVMSYAGMTLHPPMFPNGQSLEDFDEGSEERNLIEAELDKLVNIFVQITSLAKNTIKNMMVVTTSLDAEQSVKNKFADEKIEVNNFPEVKNSITSKEFVNLVENIEIKENLSLNNNSKMSKKVNELLNLMPEASDSAQEKAIKAIIADRDGLRNKLVEKDTAFGELKTEHDSLKNEIQEQKDAKAVEYVDSLIEKDKRLEDSKESLVNMAKIDLDAFKVLNPLVNKTETGADIDKDIEESDDKTEKEALEANATEFLNMSIEKRNELKNNDYAKFTKLASAYDKVNLQ